MQACSGFIKDVKRLARISFGQFRSQFDALAFAARERGTGLSELDIAQAHVLNDLDFAQYLRYILEELYGTVDGHVEHVGNGLALKAHFQRLAVVALAVTNLAGHVDVGQEVHLDCLVTVTLTGFATAAAHVERETSGLVASYLRFGQADKQVADVAEHARIGGGIGTRCAPQRRLIDVHHLVDIFQPFKVVVWQRVLQRTVELLRKDGLQGFVDERGLPATRHARHTDELTQRKLYVDALQIVATGSAQP